MNLGGDIEAKPVLYFKAILFVAVFLLAVALNLMESDLTIRIMSLALVIWSSARIYYFMFYVIENYIDKEYKFSGIYSFMKYMLKKNRM